MDQRAGNGEREDRFMFGGFTSTPFDIGDEYSFALTDLYEGNYIFVIETSRNR